MNFIHRAWTSITRRKGKSLLLFFIVFILGNVSAGAIAIQEANRSVEKTIKAQLGGFARIELDYEALDRQAQEQGEEVYNNLEKPTVEIIEQIGSLPYVKHYDYSVSTSIGSEKINPFVPEKLKEMDEGMGTREKDMFYAYEFKGVQFHKILQIEEGISTLLEGRVFTEEEIKQGSAVGLITKELAELNQLKVGDTATFTSFVLDYTQNGVGKVIVKQDFPIEIIGIYQNNKAKKLAIGTDSGKQDEYSKAFQEQMLLNTIYTPNQFNKQILQFTAENIQVPKEFESEASNEIYYEPSYILKNPEEVEAFKQEAQVFLPKYFYIQSSTDQYDAISAPIQSMGTFSKWILIISTAASILIISLVVLLFLRDRKHELGVYVALGEKKGRVFGQILIEVLLVSMLAMGAAVFSGNFLAKNVSDTLIQHQLESQIPEETLPFELTFSDFSKEITTEELVEQYHIRLSATYVGLIFGVGLFTIVVSTILPLIYILQLDPKKILM